MTVPGFPYSYKTQITLFLAAITLLINGCEYSSYELSLDDLIGTYVGHSEILEIHQKPETQKGFYKGWTHKLELKKDGTYVYIYANVEGKEIRYSGDWEYPAFKSQNKPDVSEIMLNNLGIPYADPSLKGSWMPNIYKDSAGQIKIVIDGSQSFYLIKVTPENRDKLIKIAPKKRVKKN
jgi:hypothetical protein